VPKEKNARTVRLDARRSLLQATIQGRQTATRKVNIWKTSAKKRMTKKKRESNRRSEQTTNNAGEKEAGNCKRLEREKGNPEPRARENRRKKTRKEKKPNVKKMRANNFL